MMKVYKHLDLAIRSIESARMIIGVEVKKAPQEDRETLEEADEALEEIRKKLDELDERRL